MNYRFAFLTAMTLATFAASAQWGVGLSGASQCPYNFSPGQGAVNGGDEINNLRGRMTNAEQTIERKKERLNRLNDQLKRARADMQTVLTNRVVESIIEHRRFNRNVSDYQGCSWSGGQAPSQPDLAIPGGSHNPGVDPNRVPPPEDFCYLPTKNNAWAKLALDGGRMSDTVCDYNVGTWRSRPDASRSARCREGLQDFYSVMDEKLRVETEIAQLDAAVRNYERRLNRIQDQIAEGTYCPYCQAQRSGYAGNSSSSSVFQSILPMVGMLAMAGVQYYNGEQQRKFERERMILNARTGWGAFGGPMPMPMPGPGAYPGNPYAGSLPGYMGVTNGVYGAVPGGIGAGGFGCQGTNPMMMGNPFAQPVNPFMNGNGPNVFGNPYMNPMMNPAMQNSMLMPGFGPGFMPVMGNGINGFNPYDPFNSPFNNPLNNPFAQNPFGQNPYAQNPFGMNGNPYAPAMLPYLGQNPFFQNNPYGSPYGNPFGSQFGNPYGSPYGNPYGSQFGNPYGSPYGNPYGSPFGNPYGSMYGNPYGSPYGNNPYAPRYLPYPGPGGGMYGSPYGNPYAMGGNPFGGAYGSPYGGGGPLTNYGAGYGGSGYALGNFYGQMELLKNQIQTIQSSPVFGGAAPAVLPYPGPGYGGGGGYNGSPIYNYPGSYTNPYTGGTPNIIRSR